VGTMRSHGQQRRVIKGMVFKWNELFSSCIRMWTSTCLEGGKGKVKEEDVDKVVGKK